MGNPSSSRLRFASIVAAAVVVLSSVVVASPALADSLPANPANPATPATVTADALPTPQIDGVVWFQKVVGNTVYVGGKFTNAQPYGSAAGANTVPRSYVLSYNLTTGVLNSAFAPVLNNQVRAIEASADGKTIYLSGAFTTVNGVTRNRVAAVDSTTGALVTAFNPNPNYVVNALALKGNTLWMGGAFASVGSFTRGKVAAVNATTGAVLPMNASVAGGDVTSLAISPDGSKLIIGGSFTTTNGSSNPGYGLGAVDSTTGALLPWNVNSLIRNGGSQAAIESLSADADGLYGSGYVFGSGGNLEGSFRADWTSGNLVWVEDCHGDTYSVATTANAEYVAGHPHYCGNIGGFPQTSPTWTMHRGLAFSKAATGTVTNDPYGYYNYAGNPSPTLQNWYPDFNVGTFTGQNQGPWSVATSSDSKYVVYGGEFTTVNGVRQQGLTRFAVTSIAPNKMGPQDTGSGFKPSVVSLASGSARVSWTSNWDPDNTALTYAVYRDGSGTPIYTTAGDSSVWNKPALGFVDTGLVPGSTHSYRVRATDAFGNTVIGDGASVTVSSSQPSAYTSTVLAQGASSLWRLDEASGTNVYDWAGFTDQIAGTGVTRGTAGATGDGDRASAFSGATTAFSSTQNAVAGPKKFSVEAWFNTTTTSGGKIVGFGNASTGTSSSYDRHIYMNPDGTVSFGVYNGNTQTISSAKALNDGAWHQVIGTLDPTAGMQFFVDGKLVGTRTDTTTAQDYSGYWRIGGDSSWNGSNFFTGSIDDVSVYSTPLTRQQVDAQWVAAGNTTQIAAAPSDPYGARVYNDGASLFYRLGDAAGSATAKDSSVNQSDGIYTGGVTAGVAGGIAGTTNTAAQFDGQSGQVDSSQAYDNPTVYSIESWFKTTTAVGGKIVGFGSSQTGSSSSYDRHVYMQDDGRLVFGTYTGQLNTITTPAAYNDGQWHQVVATQSSAGMKLYVDGILQGTDPQTQAQSYTGYWKIGGDNTWSSSSAYFNGSIDDVAIYDREISASTVSAHYALGSATTPNVAPTASFTSSTSDLAATFDASASNDSDGTVASYAWDFGDGASGTGRTTAHTYHAAGTYTVKLTVTDDKGATGVTTSQVVVTAPRVNVAPVASFTSGVSDLSLSVDGTASSDSDGTVASYAWTFGDGGTATTAKATHAYAAAGTYTVKLTVTDNDGATGVSTSQVTVTAPRVNSAPVASFTSTTTNLGVSVNGTASSDSDGTVASYLWDFGDGGSATTPTASHTYVAAGTYTVKLTVTDNEGAKGTATKQVTVAPPANVPPVASFTTSASALQLAVDGSGSSDSDGTVTGYAWTFGDGGTASGKTASHTYAAAGTYTVTLTVTDNQGATAVSTASVAVTKAPNVAPTASFTSTVNGLGVAVDGTSSSDPDGTVASYAWTFGDGTSASTPTASHTYTAGGTYSVKLTVTDNDGGSASSTQVVTVTAPPPANTPPTSAFTTSVSGLSITADGSASSDSDGTVASYAWDFGDGATATGKTTSHAYGTAGTYTVKLTVTDDKGATNASTQTVTLTAPADGPFVLDTFNRTVTNGFGNADTGGAWTALGGAANLSVGNGAGVIKLGGAGYQAGASLTGVSQTDTDLRATFSLDKAASGGGTQIYVSGRRVSTNTEYRATLFLSSTGKVSVGLTSYAGGTAKTIGNQTSVPITTTAGTSINFREQVTGTNPTTIKLKAWLTGTTEPTAWSFTATDSTAAIQAPGGIAIQGYVSGSSTNGVQLLSVKQLSASRP